MQLQQCLWQCMYKSMLCFRPRCCNVFVKVYWNENCIAGHWSSKHHVGQAGCCESKDRKPHLRIKFWGNQVSGIMICPINSFNPPSSRYYGNRNVKTNLTQNCQILNCQIDLIRIGMALCHCTLGCFTKTLFPKKNKRNPPRISLGVNLKGSKRIFDFDNV